MTGLRHLSLLKSDDNSVASIQSRVGENYGEDKMEIAVKTLVLGLNPMLTNHKKTPDINFPNLSCKSVYVSHQTRYRRQRHCAGIRKNHRCLSPVCAVVSGAEDVGVSSSQFDDFSVIASSTNESEKLRISVDVSGAKTREIFDEVFDKMVAAAQPIPGKTPNIPRDVLLEVLGPTKVYKEVIKKVINSTVAQYVEKEGLKVGKDLRVEQSFEELEDACEPDEKFSFEAIIWLERNK